jgi:hypothetical protein
LVDVQKLKEITCHLVALCMQAPRLAHLILSSLCEAPPRRPTLYVSRHSLLRYRCCCAREFAASACTSDGGMAEDTAGFFEVATSSIICWSTW